jgi:hypothetical protein
MKNLFLTAALVLGLAASAQTPATPVPVTTQTTSTTPATAVQVTPVASADQEKDYTKVQQAEIAPAVLKEAVGKYKGYELVEALKATDGSDYKLVLTKDGKDVAAYFKSTGEFIKEEAA